MRKLKRTLTLAVALAMILQLFIMAPLSAQGAYLSRRGTYLANFTSITREADNSFMVRSAVGTSGNQQVRIIFYSPEVFRIWTGSGTGNNPTAPADPAWRNSTIVAGTLGRTPMIANLDFGAIPFIDLFMDGETVAASTYATFKSAALTLKMAKSSVGTVFTLYTAAGDVVWEEDAPLDFTTSYTYQVLKSNANEHFYGGGVQQSINDFKGRTMNMSAAGQWNENQSSNPVPFYISSNGYGAFRNTFQNNNYTFTNADYSDIRASENRFDCFYFYGTDIRSIIDRYTTVTGKPALLPRWALGIGEFNIYKDENGDIDTMRVVDLADQYILYDMPITHFVVNDGYRPPGDRGYTELPRVIEELANRGFKTGLWTSQGLDELAKEVQWGVRAQKLDVGWVSPGFDFGLNADRLAGTTIEANSNDRAYVIACCGWAGTQRYATTWTGDQSSNWDYIRWHIPTFTGAGLSGMPFTSSDLDSIYRGSVLTYTRDLQLKTFTTTTFIMSGWSGTELKQPWFYGEPYTSINRKFLKLRQSIIPYIYSYCFEAWLTAAPVVRPMFYEFPDDEFVKGNNVPYQFMSGEYLLVAPIYSSSPVRNGIYLPEGRWTDFWSGETYYGGGMMDGYYAPLDIAPVFIRAGGIIPFYPNYTFTEKEPVDLVNFLMVPEGQSSFTLYEDQGSSQDYKKKDEYKMTLITSDAPEAGQTGPLTVTIGKAEGNAYEGMADERANNLEILMNKAPGSVTLNGEALDAFESLEALTAAGEGWYYDAAAKSGTLYVYSAARSIDEEKVFVIDEISIPSDVKGNAKLAVPTGLKTAANSSTQIRVSWNDVVGATAYDIEVDGRLFLNVTAPYIHGGVAAGSTHNYRVRAKSASGQSAWSAKFVGTANPTYADMIARGSVTVTGQAAQPGYEIAKCNDNIYDSKYLSADVVDPAAPLTLTFNRIYSVNQIRYLPPQDFVTDNVGTITEYRISVSTDGKTYYEVATGTWAADSTEKVAAFPTSLARYIRLEALASVGDKIGCALITVRTDSVNPLVMKDYALGKPTVASSEWVTDVDDVVMIPHNRYTATATSTATGRPVSNAIDQNTTSYWQSGTVPTAAAPVQFNIGLGGVNRVTQVNITPGQSGATGNITKYSISVKRPGRDTTYHVVAGGDLKADGLTKVLQFRPILATDVRLTIFDANGEARISDISVYVKPEVEGEKPESVFLMPGTNINTAGVDFTYSARSSANSINNAFDGDYTNYWDSNYSTGGFPQWIQMNLKVPTQLTQIIYVPRQSSGNGRLVKYDVWTSTNGTNWDCRIEGKELANDNTWKYIDLTEALGEEKISYIRLQVSDVSYVPSTGHMCVGEVELYGLFTAPTIDNAPFEVTPVEGLFASNYATDGNSYSNWSAVGDTNWITVDLQQEIQVREVNLNWNTLYYPNRIELFTSKDGEEWTPIYGPSTSTGGTTICYTDSVARYVKAVTTGSFLDKGIALNGFKVYGLADQATISPTVATFYKEAPAPIEVTLFNEGFPFTAIKVGSETLVEGQDYTVDGDVITLTVDYLNSLATGTTKLDFSFVGCSDRGLSLTIFVVDKSALKEALEAFEALPPAENFTAFTYQPALDAYNEGVQIYNSASATKNEADNAAAVLMLAIERLEYAPAASVKINTPTNVAIKRTTTYDLKVTWQPSFVPLKNISCEATNAGLVKIALKANNLGSATFAITGLKTGSTVLAVRANDGSGVVASVILTVSDAAPPVVVTT